MADEDIVEVAAEPAPAVEPVVEEPAADEPEPAPVPDNLAPVKPSGCLPDTCQIEPRPWSGREHYYCDACNHSTFSADEALGRRPSLKA